RVRWRRSAPYPPPTGCSPTRPANGAPRCPSGHRPAARYSCAAPEKRLRPCDRSRIGLAEIPEPVQCFLGVLAVAQQKRVEAAAFHVVQMVAHHLAYGPQLALVAVTLAQQRRDRITAAVAKLREIHFDARDAAEPIRDRRRIVGRLEPQHLTGFR